MNEYQTIKVLGKGGFGVVEEVEDSRGRRLARKKFSPDPRFSNSEEDLDKLRKRFRREVMTQGELGGREIMPVLDSDLNSSEPWFIMPLADRTYEEQISIDKQSGKIEIDAIADILNGLDYLHSYGFVHRDLNPKNILLHEGHWKLSDLGSVLPPTGQTVTLTEDTVIFTERYCSPEQRGNFHKAKPPTDIYAFGCLLHDIFGSSIRTPYSKHTAEGNIGVIIGKCTEPDPNRRPNIKVLRQIVIDELVELGGKCQVADPQSEEWLKKLNRIEEWTDSEYEEFVRFFSDLDTSERTNNNESWLNILSTPFLTRIPIGVIKRIVEREDGYSAAIIEKYCIWVRGTSFSFYFSDIVCDRLTEIFDNGGVEEKALALTSLIMLAESHNRWYIMRELLIRCSEDKLSKEESKRLSIEIKLENVERQFRRCLEEIEWQSERLAADLAIIID